MGRNEEIPDSTAWILENEIASFVLMHTNEIKYMCMLGYTYFHGCKVFKSIATDAPFSFKFVNMLIACTGGGILVPIFINSIPVPLTFDSYPIAILISFAAHTYCPVLRDVLELSPVFKGAVVFLYETLRAAVVCKLTLAAGAAIPPSEFSFPLFGPIFCGTIAGCGGAFLPLNKGLDPLRRGLAPPMYSSFIGALFLHLVANLAPASIEKAALKAQVIVAVWFILYGFYSTGVFKGIGGSRVAAKNGGTPRKKIPMIKKDKKR